MTQHAGRLMLNQGQASRQAQKAFYWFRGNKSQVFYWLTPFVCASAQTNLNESALESGLLSDHHLLPMELKSLMSYTQSGENGFSLQGLAALLANVYEHYNKDLHYHSREFNGQQILTEWSLNTFSSDMIIEFSFLNYNYEESKQAEIDDFMGLIITVSEENWTDDMKKRTATVKAQITVLKAEFDFLESILHIPQGYSCRRSYPLPFNLYNSGPVLSDSAQWMQYTIQVTASIAGDYETFVALPPSVNQFSMLTPMDSMHNPQSSSSQLTLLLDVIDHTIATISFKEDGDESTLTIWDLKTKKKQAVKRSDHPICQDPESFRSSLFERGSAMNAKISSSICEMEQVEVKLSDSISIKINDAGLKLLTLSLQNKQNYAQLIDVIQTSDSNWDLTYEMPVNDLFCMKLLFASDDNLAEMPQNSIRLVTKYSYAYKSNIWTPKSSSLLIFDGTQTKLMAAIHLHLVYFQPYKPWTSSSHLLDLSACKSGPKESAIVRIEYPLTKTSLHLRQVDAPHELIRTALANYLQQSYSLSLTRVPSIKVQILDNLVQVDIRLLDRWDLLSDSSLLRLVDSSREQQYLAWLRNATRSVLTNSESNCAEYCQHYQCTQYVFCQDSLACYIFHSTSWSNSISGSYESENLHCNAFNVLSSRLDIGGHWKKSSWSLEEILESLVDSCGYQSDQNKSSFVSVGNSRKKTGDQVEDSIKFTRTDVMQPSLTISSILNKETNQPASSRLISLYPSFAHYFYERQATNAFVADNNGDDDSTMIGMSKSEPSLAYFRIAFNGFRFVDRDFIVQHNKELHLFLGLTDDKVRGHLTLEDHPMIDCARQCLADLNCRSISYCSNSNFCILANLSRAEIDSRLSSDPSQLNLQRSSLTIESANRCSISVRTYSDQFERFERRSMASGHAGRLIEEVVDVFGAESGEDCAISCVQNRADGLKSKTWQSVNLRNSLIGSDDDDTCLSYDFCRGVAPDQAASCVLFKQRLVTKADHSTLTSSINKLDDEASRSKVGNETFKTSENLLDILMGKLKMDEGSDCWHYVRNFLIDFDKIGNRRLADSMKALVLKNYADKQLDDNNNNNSATNNYEKFAETGEGVSLVHCARLCEEDPNCGAFEYCAASHDLAPNGLYVSCSLGDNGTLEMAPPVATGGKAASSRQETATATLTRKHQEIEMALLSKSRICSVYTYKSLSLIFNHKKKKNLSQLGAELLVEAADRSHSIWLTLIRLDLLVLVAFFLFGLIVRNNINFARFNLHRFRERSGMTSRRDESGVHLQVGNPTMRAIFDKSGAAQQPATDNNENENDNNHVQLDIIRHSSQSSALEN